MNTPGEKLTAPWLALISRTVLFAVFQCLIAGILVVTGSTTPWKTSADWWPFSAIFTNIVSIILLFWLFRREDKRYFDFLCFSRQTMWRDVGITLLLGLVAIPLVTYPNQWLAKAIFGSRDIGFWNFVRPLPLWAVMVSTLFPITIVFAELPTYFGYVMPRLERQLGNGWYAWAVVSSFLVVQHATLPVVLDWRFIVWRIGMMIPLSFLLGLCLKLRPQVFPYVMVGHGLLDMTTVVTLLTLE